MRVTSEPTNAIFNLQGSLSEGMLNEFKIGYNGPPTTIAGQAPVVNGIDFGNLAFNLGGSIANTGIAGQSSSSGLVVPGGLVRANSATNGRGQPYDPWSLAFADVATRITGNHLPKVGVDVRMIRMTTDQLGGTTYTYPNITAFLANQPQSIQYLGDISAPSVFNNGATGMRHTEQTYFVGFAQDEWHATSDLTLNYGLRYDYYTPMKERDNLIVKFNTVTGQIDPNTTPFLISKKNSFQPRVSMTYAPGKTVFRAGFGVFVGPGQGEDQIQPIESDRVSTTLSTVRRVVSDQPGRARRQLHQQPEQPQLRAARLCPEYQIPEKVYQYTASVQQELGGRFTASAAFVGAEGRDLFLRTITNRITDVITNPNPANAALVVREFSIVQRDAAGNVTGVQNPYAEVDVKTTRRLQQLQRDDAVAQPPLGERPEHQPPVHARQEPGTTGGSNEANTAANNANAKEIAVRLRQRLQQLRRAPHLQLQPAVFDSVRQRSQVRRGRRLLAGRPRRLGRRRHRQRAQRRADPGADRSSRRRLSGWDRRDLREPGGGSRRRSSTRPAAARRATCAVRT